MTGNERVTVQASHSRRFKKRKRVKLKRSRGKRREHAIVSPLVKKYWLQRYNLFSRYDEGVKLDEEGWYSVTPEEIAIRHAEMCRGRIVIDCFAGVGGNAIQFAILCHHVVAIDIDPQKIALAFHNAKIYGVADRIDFVVGDFFQLAPSLKVASGNDSMLQIEPCFCFMNASYNAWYQGVAWVRIIQGQNYTLHSALLSVMPLDLFHQGDIVYLSPPWGGPSYKMIQQFNLDLLKPKDGYSVFQAAQRITPNIVMFLPRNMDLNQVEELSWLSSPPLHVEIEENYVDGNFKGITAYFGDAASRQA